MFIDSRVVSLVSRIVKEDWSLFGLRINLFIFHFSGSNEAHESCYTSVYFQIWRLPWNSLLSVVPSRSPWTDNSTTDVFQDSLVFSDVSFKIESGFPAQNRQVTPIQIFQIPLKIVGKH